MDKIITKALPGFMELLPEEQIEFDRIKKTILEIYEQFGFTALDTPVIERSKTLLAKAGGETEKQIYSVENKRGVDSATDESGNAAELSLRFDLTVPLARYVAEHFNNLSFPFRRCHISKVYRGERPQKGRFREFYQCDIDVIGKDKLSINYDAEIPSIIYRVFKKLNFGKFTIRINNRKLLNGLFDSLNAEVDSAEILRIIDKVEKIPKEDFIRLLSEQKLTDDLIDKLLKFISIRGDVGHIVSQLKKLNISNELFQTGIDELETVTEQMLMLGVHSSYFTIDLSIARGLDYYTGTVYETILDDYPKVGSVCSGGRFDDLATYYTEEKLPGVGISIGLTRLFYQLRQAGLIHCSKKTIADIIVIPMDSNNIATALRVSQILRDEGHKVDVLLEDMAIKKKFQYVSKKDAPIAIVIGSEEEETGQLTIRYKSEERVVNDKVSLELLSEYIVGIMKRG